MPPAFAAVPEPCDGWSGRVREGIQDATAQRSRLRKAEPTRLGNRLRQQGNRSAMATGPSPAATTVAPTSALGGLPGLLGPRFPRCQEFLLLARPRPPKVHRKFRPGTPRAVRLPPRQKSCIRHALGIGDVEQHPRAVDDGKRSVHLPGQTDVRQVVGRRRRRSTMTYAITSPCMTCKISLASRYARWTVSTSRRTRIACCTSNSNHASIAAPASPFAPSRCRPTDHRDQSAVTDRRPFSEWRKMVRGFFRSARSATVRMGVGPPPLHTILRSWVGQAEKPNSGPDLTHLTRRREPG